jgi:hypothetical protein
LYEKTAKYKGLEQKRYRRDFAVIEGCGVGPGQVRRYS